MQCLMSMPNPSQWSCWTVAQRQTNMSRYLIQVAPPSSISREQRSGPHRWMCLRVWIAPQSVQDGEISDRGVLGHCCAKKAAGTTFWFRQKPESMMITVRIVLLNPLVPQMEIQLAITKKKMETAAEEERFQDAAKFRDRLEVLRLEQR